ncbi:LysR family transcriptional regulator [Reinekea marinisedimentorum]|uniref:DNA-binding transcriptional LysR family regulator n=1 Tax=Reinekea marinisedimentorum TaxID=230495 RepID=A0A4R3I1V6_9GAMM|nr:LysR family transcriptional regulator [Reinekea marinisedimentorum]TCS39746.1 DNA-binding transcriptional LysR family regulator [Reinekea marinisedimentorum]
MINPQWLRTYCTLVEVGHFTQTAERLHMTQSGVSQHIRKLEEQVGADLLVREGKQFSLTHAGERLYSEAQQIVTALTELKQRIKEDPPFEGEVRLMSPGSVGLRLYPRLLALQSQHRQLVIDYRFAPNSDIQRSIAKSTADIGLMTAASTVPEVYSIAIAEEPLLLVTPAHIEEPGWEVLLQLGFVDHPDGAYHAQLLLSENYPQFQNSRQFCKSGFSNQINLILEPVSRGLGFTVLPKHAVEAFAKREQIRVHLLPKPVTETLYLATHTKKPLLNRMNTVIDELKKWI